MLADYGWTKARLGGTPLRKLGTGVPGYALAALTRTLPTLLTKRMTRCRIINRGGEAVRLGARGSVLGRPVPRGEVIYEGPMRLCAPPPSVYVMVFGCSRTRRRPTVMQLRVDEMPHESPY